MTAPAGPGFGPVRPGISAETLRKIETGRIPTPAFFTVAALADVLGLSLDGLSVEFAVPDDTGSQAS